MHIVQFAAGQVLQTKRVYYKDAGSTPILAGYALCYDIAAPDTPAAGTFDEEVLGIRVVKPATANLFTFAGIVKNPPRTRISATDNSGFCEIYVPQPGDILSVWTHENMTAVTTALGVANADFGLVADAQYDGTNKRPSIFTLALALETANTSGTAALKKVVWLK